MYKLKKPETGKYGKWTTESWGSPILEDKYGYDLEFGRRKAQLNKREVSPSGAVGYPEITDLRDFESFVLPEGSEIVIRKKIIDDTISVDLCMLMNWAQSMEASSELIVQSG